MKQKHGLQKNQCYQVTIDELGHKGAGISMLDNKKVIIPNTLPKEEVSFKLIKLNKNHAFGKVVHIITPSKNRQEPPCPVASQCGGCQLQHQEYGAQLTFKHDFIQSEFKKYPNINAMHIHPVIAADSNLEYRNKAQFVINHSKTNTSTFKQVGLYAANSHRVIDINYCHIQNPIINDVLKKVRTWIQTSSVSIYNEETHQGALRHVVVRVGASTKEVMVAVVSTTNEIDTTDLKEALQKRSQSNTLGYTINSILLNKNPNKTDTILGDETLVLDGQDHITDLCGHIKVKLSLKSFYQSNPDQTKVLYDHIKQVAEFSPDDTVLDLYSGIGTIGLYVADKVKSVVGIEENPAAVDNANDNAELNQIQNIQFIQAEVEPYLTKNPISSTDTVIVDPPRKGCGTQLITQLLSAKPKKIVYVSCNPISLAPELEKLIQNGYSATSLQPIDMFPQTVHVESVVVLDRNK